MAITVSITGGPRPVPPPPRVRIECSQREAQALVVYLDRSFRFQQDARVARASGTRMPVWTTPSYAPPTESWMPELIAALRQALWLATMDNDEEIDRG